MTDHFPVVAILLHLSDEWMVASALPGIGISAFKVRVDHSRRHQIDVGHFVEVLQVDEGEEELYVVLASGCPSDVPFIVVRLLVVASASVADGPVRRLHLDGKRTRAIDRADEQIGPSYIPSCRDGMEFQVTEPRSDEVDTGNAC